nr:hypothetical protein [White spot syndrome virus]WUY11739.1 hypothetical protein [White spot syndrome virus]
MDFEGTTSSTPSKMSQLYSSVKKVAEHSFANLHAKATLASKVIKDLEGERKKMSTPKSSSDGQKLDKAMLDDIINEYQAVKSTADNSIESTIKEIENVLESVRRTKIESEAKNSVTSSPEKVFSVEDLEIYSKGRVCKGLKLNANCSRIGGKYAVSMSIKKHNVSSFENNNNQVFSEEPRDCFMLETTYPLVGFETSTEDGNTYAVFLTGVGLERSLPKYVPVFDMNAGIQTLNMTGLRMAKLPVLCMFGRTEYDNLEDFYITSIETQSFDEEENDARMRCHTEDLERKKRMNDAPAITPHVAVYDYSGDGKEQLLYMITEYENTASWCNANGVVTSDSGFSNECAISDMNDLCCFADCIDVTVNNEEHEERSMNIVVESDRRLFDASPSPIKTEEDGENSSSSSSSPTVPPPTPYEGNAVVEGEEEEEEIDEDESSKYEGSEDALVMKKLAKLSTMKQMRRVKNEPALKITSGGNNSSSSINNEDDGDDDDAVDATALCPQTEATVKNSFMAPNDERTENILYETMQNSLAKICNNPSSMSSYRVFTNKLQECLNTMDDSIRRRPTIWTEESQQFAKGLLFDEVVTSIVAHQMAQDICKSEIFGGMFNANSTNIKGKYEGQKKSLYGNKHISSSCFKTNTESNVNNALFAWVKSKLHSGTVIPNVFSFKMASEKPSKMKRKRTSSASSSNDEHQEPSTKMMKNDEGEKVAQESSSPSSSSTPEQQQQAGHDKETINLIPLSFIKMPRSNVNGSASYLSEIFGQRLCGLSDASSTFKRMCKTFEDLENEIMRSSFTRLTRYEREVTRLYEKCRSQAVDIEENEMDVLSHQGELFAEFLEDPIAYFEEVLENIKSWSLENVNTPKRKNKYAKVLVSVNAIRRTYEEYHAFSKFVPMFLFNLIKRELEGDNYTHDVHFSSTCLWYLTVMTRNRICDVLQYINNNNNDNEETDIVEEEEEGEGEEDKMEESMDVEQQKQVRKGGRKKGQKFNSIGDQVIRKFVKSLCENSMVVSIAINSLISGISWMNKKIPPGFLKDSSTINTLDEVSRFVFSDVKINRKINGTDDKYETVFGVSTRVDSHIVGPFSIPVDFSSAGLDKASCGKLYVNTIDGKGILTISPKYDSLNDEDVDSTTTDKLEKDILHLSKHDTFFNINKNKVLPFYNISPSSSLTEKKKTKFNRKKISSGMSNNNGMCVQTPSSSNSVSSVSSIVAPSSSVLALSCSLSSTKKKSIWNENMFLTSRNMWRCGFVVPPKLCSFIVNHRHAVKLVAETAPKTKLCRNIIDRNRKIRFNGLKKVCKSVSAFTGESTYLLNKNMTATSPSDLNLCIYISSLNDPLYTCKLTHEEYQDGNALDDYGAVFVNYTFKSIKSCSSKDETADDNAAAADDDGSTTSTSSSTDTDAAAIQDFMHVMIKKIDAMKDIRGKYKKSLAKKTKKH